MCAMVPAPVYALLADGSTILVRPAGPADFEVVKTMHEAMSPDHLYLQFFNGCSPTPGSRCGSDLTTG